MTSNPIILSSAPGFGIKVEEGLISTVLAAFDNQRPLVLRPDDLWQAIMNQLACYLNNNYQGL